MASHDHGLRSRPGQRFGLTFLADTHEQTALRRRRNHVPVQHEADTAEHLHLANVADSLERRAHACGEIVFSGHAKTPFVEDSARTKEMPHAGSRRGALYLRTSTD